MASRVAVANWAMRRKKLIYDKLQHKFVQVGWTDDGVDSHDIVITATCADGHNFDGIKCTRCDEPRPKDRFELIELE